jgi:hypothetical protein
MPRRPADTVTMTVWLTVREGLILDEMRTMVAIDSNANLLRAALFMYAKHLNIPHLHYTDFGIRRAGQSGEVTRASKPRSKRGNDRDDDHVRRSRRRAAYCREI